MQKADVDCPFPQNRVTLMSTCLASLSASWRIRCHVVLPRYHENEETDLNRWNSAIHWLLREIFICSDSVFELYASLPICLCPSHSIYLYVGLSISVFLYICVCGMWTCVSLNCFCMFVPLFRLFSCSSCSYSWKTSVFMCRPYLFWFWGRP